MQSRFIDILIARSVVLSLLLSILGQASAFETADCHDLSAMVTTTNINVIDVSIEHQHHHAMMTPAKVDPSSAQVDKSSNESNTQASNCCDSINCSCSSACSSYNFVGQDPFVWSLSTRSFAISAITQIPPASPISSRYRPPITA